MEGDKLHHFIVSQVILFGRLLIKNPIERLRFIQHFVVVRGKHFPPMPVLHSDPVNNVLPSHANNKLPVRSETEVLAGIW